MENTLLKKEADILIPEVKIPDHPEKKELSEGEKTALKDKIKQLLKKENGVLVAHYYTDGDLQDLAERNRWVCGRFS